MESGKREEIISHNKLSAPSPRFKRGLYFYSFEDFRLYKVLLIKAPLIGLLAAVVILGTYRRCGRLRLFGLLLNSQTNRASHAIFKPIEA